MNCGDPLLGLAKYIYYCSMMNGTTKEAGEKPR